MIHYTDDQITLHHGDALEVARELPSGAADCIVTSPPYFGLRDYGIEGQYGLEASPAEYVETMRALFSELRRVLADDGTLWLNIGDSYNNTASNQHCDHLNQGKEYLEVLRPEAAGGRRKQRQDVSLPPKNLLGIPWRTAFALQDDGWILRNAIIWNKPNAMPESVTDRLSGRYEHVFLFSKSRRYWFDLDAIREPTAQPGRVRADKMGGNKGDLTHHSPGAIFTGCESRNPGDVWSITTQPFTAAHFAVMPVALALRCIQAGCTPKRCAKCGHAPEPIVEKTRPPEKKRRGRSADMTAASFQRSNLSGQEWNAWKAENPDKVTGHTDCGHNAYRAGTVLDPFSGSGTTGLAAQRTGCRYIGIDLSAEYLDLSLRTRLLNGSLDFEEEPA